jgi:hypothetical protein
MVQAQVLRIINKKSKKELRRKNVTRKVKSRLEMLEEAKIRQLYEKAERIPTPGGPADNEDILKKILEGLENAKKVNPLTNEAHRGRMLQLLDEILIDPNDPQNAGVILASRIRFEINKIVDDYWLTDLSSNISALSEAVHGGVEWDHRVEYRRQALADLQEFRANSKVFKRAVRDVWPSSMGNPVYALEGN